MTRTLAALGLSVLAGLPALAPAQAQDTAPYPYAAFEVSMPHIDLDECPEGLATGVVFCRVTMNNDALHVYVFDAGGDQHFVAVHSFYEDEFELILGH